MYGKSRLMPSFLHKSQPYHINQFLANLTLFLNSILHKLSTRKEYIHLRQILKSLAMLFKITKITLFTVISHNSKTKILLKRFFMNVTGFILNVNETAYLYGSKEIYRRNVRITPSYPVLLIWKLSTEQ